MSLQRAWWSARFGGQRCQRRFTGRFASRRSQRPPLRLEVLEGRLPLSAGPADFNGDGYADLAIGAASENLDGMADTGAVHVIYGSADGLSARGDHFWSQSGLLTESGWTEDIFGEVEAGDAFGSALATGDFNGDGYSDLAIGVPGESVRVDGSDVAGAAR